MSASNASLASFGYVTNVAMSYNAPCPAGMTTWPYDPNSLLYFCYCAQTTKPESGIFQIPAQPSGVNENLCLQRGPGWGEMGWGDFATNTTLFCKQSATLTEAQPFITYLYVAHATSGPPGLGYFEITWLEPSGIVLRSLSRAQLARLLRFRDPGR